MPSAIVTGATGITGSAIVHHLCKDSFYDKVYSLSRSNPGYQDSKIQHEALDLQTSVDDMAKTLAGISAEYIYFCAYLARDDPAESSCINGVMLSNFIQALETTGAIKNLKRFVLTCGFKHYGVHLGNCKQPLLEDDPILDGNKGGRILAEAASRGQWEWIATLPEDVLGYARGNFMNEATALGLYCAVSKVLPGSELPFPGCKANYFAFNCWTSANLHAKFCLWAATAKNAGNNIFNVMNGIRNLFKISGLALRLASAAKSPILCSLMVASRTRKASRILNIGVSLHPEKQETPTLFLQVDPEKWAKRRDVNETWVKLRDTYKLDQVAWDKATWDSLTFVLGRDWSCVGSMSKARKLGWTGYADTWDELEETFEILEKEEILPPVEQLKRDFQSTWLGTWSRVGLASVSAADEIGNV
ncbi:hypothetical protein BDV35DRAFT_395154 [Aspergillus flavus]|uniref:PRISE-like Rossmann-fold domain-containing protein n=1 Tax=Aspergillus flavus TaxID=5059 RepID=A0A5N6GPA9_ASPFL|nr:hypothetical protein BDV35DRAFT_395154 [Aspergillus flavus]